MKIKLRESIEIFSLLSDEVEITLHEFIKIHYETIRTSLFSKKTIYEFLIKKGLNIGSYESFISAYNYYARKLKKLEDSGSGHELIEAQGSRKHETPTTAKVKEDVKETAKPEPKKHPAVRPIFIDGREIFIDPETGAKTFKI